MNPAKAPAPPPVSRRPVMIIDDNRDILNALEFLLLSEGIESIVAHDGLDALTKLDAGKVPCLILLDMLMPEMDGWQFRKAQLADPKLAKIPVVVITAVDQARNSALRFGASSFLTKPVHPDSLLGAFRQLA